MATCKELDKSVGPTTCLTFLGIEIDTLTMELRDKLNQLEYLLDEWQFKKVAMLKQNAQISTWAP